MWDLEYGYCPDCKTDIDSYLFHPGADKASSQDQSIPQVVNAQEEEEIEEIENITVIEDPTKKRYLGEEDIRPEEGRRSAKKANLNSTPEVMEEGNTSGVRQLLLYSESVKFGEEAEIGETDSEEEEGFE